MVGLQTVMEDFRDYFLGTLGNNFGSFPLLAAYMEQINNCSLNRAVGFPGCVDVSSGQMGLRYAQGSAVRSATLAAYAAATLGRALDKSPPCLSSLDNPACLQVARQALRDLRYDFGPDDPGILSRFVLQMDREPESKGLFVARNLVIEAVQEVHTAAGRKLRKVDSSKPSVLIHPVNGCSYRCSNIRLEESLDGAATSFGPPGLPFARTATSMLPCEWTWGISRNLKGSVFADPFPIAL